MRTTLFLFLIIFAGLTSCEKNDFNIENPNVEIFVKQLKKGTYNQYEKNEKGESLWLKMPEFKKKHIYKLIELAADTTHISNFPINPISSRQPTPGRDFILGETLLWIVDGIIKGVKYPSLDPYIINTSLPDKDKFKGISAKEILQVQDIYKEWWKNNKHKNQTTTYPLDNTPYRWM